jgi:translation initiation factor 1
MGRTVPFRAMAKGKGDMVWSSSDGDLRKARDPKTKARTTTGPVKVRRETAGRKGKTVTTVFNLPLSDDEVRALAGQLKKRCGVGGSSKDGVIELQGDHRDTVVDVLKAHGYDVVRAGG